MNVTTPIVSLIIPVYNREDVVEECIRSVQDQTHQQFEILLIDDGSTDSTVAICNDLAAQDPRIKLFTTEHVGVSAARNIGLDNACGEFVFFLDSDDVIHPQLLEVLISELEKSNTPIAVTERRQCRHSAWVETKERFLQEFSSIQFTHCNYEESLSVTFGTNSPFRVMGGVMIRRTWIGNTRFCTDLFIGEDFFFSYENLIKGADAVFLKQRGYLSRLHDGNTSWQYDFNGFWTRFYRRKLVWQSEESFGRSEYAALQKQNAYHCFVMCFQKNKPYSADSRKMLAVLREHRDDILPVLPKKARLLCGLYLHCPATAWLLFQLKNSVKAVIHKQNKKTTRKNGTA